MLKLIFSLMLAVAVANSGDVKPKNGCILSQEGKVFVKFEAHKTPSNKAVGGQFEDVKFTPAALSGNNFREIFVGSSFVINSKSAVIKTKEKEKESELMKFFFDNMNIDNIKAKIVDIKSDAIVKGKPKTGKFFVDMHINGAVKNVPMDFKFDAGELTANGVLDVSAFDSILIFELVNQEFVRQHKERVLKSVDIGFSTKIKSDLCYVAR
ncbi:MAG: YceI family protein [Sulfurimonas sp.]|jgi:hypothetical protein